MSKLFIVVLLVVAISQLAFAGRYYDPYSGRFLQIDPKAHNYPAWSPYTYALNNPLRFVDPSGDSVEINKMTNDQQIAFNRKLQDMLKSRQFARVWNTLTSSKAIYYIVIDAGQNEGALFQPNSEATGSGGTLSFQNTEGFDGVFTFAHEGWHAFEHDQADPGRVVGIEIEANLFANSVAFELGAPLLLSGATQNSSTQSAFSTAFEALQFDNAFSPSAWSTANRTFKLSDFNSSGRYNSYGVRLYSPLIKQFYPLVK